MYECLTDQGTYFIRITNYKTYEEQLEEGFHFKADHIKATKVYYRKNKHKIEYFNLFPICISSRFSFQI